MKIGPVIRLDDESPGVPRSYVQIREMARQAEALGFDAIWLWDHFLHRAADKPTHGIWECWTVLSALAEATKTIELGTLVVCTQFRNPALLAKMAVTLDEVSGGRFILGVGAGWNEPEFTAFGFPFDHRVSRFAEALQIIRPLLKTGRVDFAGQYYQARDCEIAPRGPRPAGPPLLIAAFGPRMLQLTAEHADLWNGTAAIPSHLDSGKAQLATACATVGRDPSEVGITADVRVLFPDLLSAPSELNPQDCLTGSPIELAAQFTAFEQAGVVHLMFECYPYTEESLGRVAEAVRLLPRGLRPPPL